MYVGGCGAVRRLHAGTLPLKGKTVAVLESRLEAFTNRWVSHRVVRGWDDLHMSLDRLVEAHPMPAGWLLACTSAAAALCAVSMLVRYY